MSANIATWYWIISVIVFVYWFSLFYGDRSTSMFDPISWLVLVMAALFWPIVLPICSWELSSKSLKNFMNLD